MKRTIFVYKDNNELKAATGDLDLTSQSSPIEIEFELDVDGSVTDAGYSGWAFGTDAGSSSNDQVDSHGAVIERASGNTSGESVSAQFSVALNRHSNLVITDQNNDATGSNGAGTFTFTITVVFGTNGNTSPPSPVSVATDPMIYNR